MNRRDYEWHINYCEEELMNDVTELKKIVNGINSASDVNDAFYNIQVKYEELSRNYGAYNYLRGIEYEFKKKEGDKNDE